MSAHAAMETNSAESLKRLIAHEQPHSVSIIMPTHRSGSRVEENAIRFKNLLRQVVEQMTSQEMSEKIVEDHLSSLFARQRDDNFWQHQSDGVAIYFCDGKETILPLHFRPQETAHVSNRFCILPIALDAASATRSNVLCVSWEAASLHLADREQLDEVVTEQFPVAIRDVVLPPDAEDQLQFRTQTQSQGTAMFHGQGAGEETIDSDRQRFLAEVGRRVEDYLEKNPGTLMIVATDEVAGHLLANSDLEATTRLTASPDGLNEQQLKKRVHEVLQEDSNEGEDWQERFGTAAAAGKASSDVDDVLRAASAGRVEVLLIDEQRRVWGRWDEAKGEVELLNDTRAAAGAEELVNLAAVKTLQTGGNVLPASSELLRESAMAAIYRY